MNGYTRHHPVYQMLINHMKIHEIEIYCTMKTGLPNECAFCEKPKVFCSHSIEWTGYFEYVREHYIMNLKRHLYNNPIEDKSEEQ